MYRLICAPIVAATLPADLGKVPDDAYTVFLRLIGTPLMAEHLPFRTMPDEQTSLYQPISAPLVAANPSFRTVPDAQTSPY